MAEERDQALIQRSSNVAKNVAKALARQLKLRISEKASEDEVDDLLEILDSFEEAFIRKLLEKKPVALLFSKSPDISIMGLEGLKELTPYFSFRMSIVFDWNVGRAQITYF